MFLRVEGLLEKSCEKRCTTIFFGEIYFVQIFSTEKNIRGALFLMGVYFVISSIYLGFKYFEMVIFCLLTF